MEQEVTIEKTLHESGRVGWFAAGVLTALLGVGIFVVAYGLLGSSPSNQAATPPVIIEGQ